MTRWIALWLFCQVPAAAQDNLDGAVKQRLAHFSGKVSIYAKNLKTGGTYDLGGANRVTTASTIKLPIMIAVYTAVHDGRVKWTDTSELTKQSKVPGSGVLQELSDENKIPLSDLVRLMILLSDNTATNLVLAHVPGNEVNAVMDRMGIKDTRSLRKILGPNGSPEGVSDAGRDPANKRFGIGVSTPRDMVSLLERLYRGEIVSQDDSKEMLGILKKQMWRDGLPRRLGATEVADKPGALDHLRSDVGIVFAKDVAKKDAPVAIAITCEDIPEVDWSPDNPGYLLIADVAKTLVEGLTR